METDSLNHNEKFETLLDSTLSKQKLKEGEVIPGVVIDIQKQYVLVDVGLKSEGKIPLQEFQLEDGYADYVPNVGDMVRVSLQRIENPQGLISLSRSDAIQVEAWEGLQEKYVSGEIVEGEITERIRGGFSVLINGAKAFLPNTQLDIKPIKNIYHLFGKKEKFQILKMDIHQSNIVVSRRAVLEAETNKSWAEKASQFVVGQEIEGTVKNITDYGAFLDLGGVDGLLHVTDMSWSRISSPNDFLKVGEVKTLKILSLDIEHHRISLGLKQLHPNPWTDVENRFVVGGEVQGTVVAVLDYGVFVDLGNGFEGLIHISEISWVRTNVHPSTLFKVGDTVKVKVLGIDEERHRIALSIKQLLDNPWREFETTHPEQSQLEVIIKEINSYGLKVELENQISGSIRLSDLDWIEPGEVAIKKYNVGDKINTIVLSIDEDHNNVTLGVKQLEKNPIDDALQKLKVGSLVTATIVEKDTSNLRVLVRDVLRGTIRKSELAKDRIDQRTDRFAVGEKIDACITHIGKEGRLTLSIKTYEERIENEAMEKYGHTDSGASLGDILGVALEKAGKSDLNTNSDNSLDETEKS